MSDMPLTDEQREKFMRILIGRNPDVVGGSLLALAPSITSPNPRGKARVTAEDYADKIQKYFAEKAITSATIKQAVASIAADLDLNAPEVTNPRVLSEVKTPPVPAEVGVLRDLLNNAYRAALQPPKIRGASGNFP